MTERTIEMYSPVDRCDYKLLQDGHVLVENRTNGKSGLFTAQGSWISGDLRFCDPQMLIVLRPHVSIPFSGLKQK